jgi:hypothetical protein
MRPLASGDADGISRYSSHGRGADMIGNDLGWISHKTVRVNKRTGKRVTECLMNNECLVCDGSCKGYSKTEVTMRPRRAAYRKAKQDLQKS